MILINGEIHTMAGKVFSPGYLEMKDGLIARTGPMEELFPVPQDAVDLGGAQVLPGFIDAHCHIGMWEDSLGFEGEDGNEETDPCTPHLRAVDAVNPRDRGFLEAARAGVLTVVTGPGSANPIGGQMCAMKTVGIRVDDMLISGCIGIKFALGENPKGCYHDKSSGPATRMATAALIREQLFKAQRYLRDKQEAELDEELDEPEFDFKCEALIPLLEKKVKAHFHAHRADDIFTAIRIAQEFDLDYLLIHCTEGHLIAGELAKEGAFAVTGPCPGSRSKPELKDQTVENPGVLSRAGVLTAICTDHPELPIEQLPLCAGFAVEGGMDREEALRAITIHPAKMLGIDGRLGSLEPGKEADVLVFRRDPLSLGGRPEMVFCRGERIL
ncbi:MAG: amidohydrolase [Oscillospiraceae bacterium]|nr:amidohydrolase [Oscillospiraceae bacterium]